MRRLTFLFATMAGMSALCAADTALPATNIFARPTNSIRITSAWLSDLSEEMRTNNPAIDASRWRAKAAQVNIESVRRWEDPMATIGAMGAREMMRAEDGDLIYGVEQKLPLFGKPTVARQMAEADAAMQEARVDERYQLLRRDLAKVVFRAGLAERSVKLGYDDVTWLDTLAQSVDARYRSGTASLSELLQAQNEHARRVNQVRTDESRVAHEQIGVNRLLNRPTSFQLPRLELPEIAPPVPFTPRLVELAWKFEPKLRVMQKELAAAETSVDAARRMRLPDVSVGAEGRNYSRDGDLRSAEVMLKFSVPWGNRSKYDADIKREKAKVTATEYDIEAEQHALTEEVHQLTFMIDNARREALLYRDEIVPRTRTALDAAHSAWSAGTGMLRDVIEARRMLTEAELMYARAVAEQYDAMSELVLCCGIGDFEALRMISVKEQPVRNR
jgi:outer membrane protein, heavy metal efflux system